MSELDDLLLFLGSVERHGVRLEDVRVFADVGSRDAKVAMRAKTHLPAAHVYAFECNPDALSICRHNLRGRDGVTLVEKAVCNTDGPVQFHAIDPERTLTPHADGNIGASSLFIANPEYPLEKYAQRAITVEGVRLETWAKAAGVAAVDLLWLDLQGAELMALRGMGPLLGTVKAIFTEVAYKPVYLGQPLAGEMMRFFGANGFSLLQALPAGEWFGNEIWVRRSA